MGHVINTSIINRDSAVSEICDYLQDECGFISPETVQILFDQEVSGSEFFDFNDDILRQEFPQISYGQRKKLMKIVEAHAAHVTIDSINLEELGCDFLSSFEQASNSAANSSQADMSLAGPSQGESSQLRPIDEQCAGPSHADGSQQRPIDKQCEVPVLAPYKVVRKRSKQKSSSTKRCKNEVDAESVEPLDVLSILKSKKMGQTVIDYVRQEKMINKSHQETMMKLLYLHVSADKKSPIKYYPDRTLKISMAKGIVAAFPELRDDGDCPWKTWLKKVITKFETVQSNLPAEKKKYKFVKNNSANSGSSLAMDEVNVDEDSNTDLTHSTTEWMNNAIPNPQNRKEISLGLKMTFEGRARWIKQEKPSCTDILTRYKHLASYDGDMINEEFGRREVLAHDLETRFPKVAKSICLLFEKQKSEALVKEVYSQFEDVNLRALVALPKLLPPHLSSRTTDVKIINHVKSFKHVLEKVPSCALLQIAPEGVDPEAYVSSEYCEEENLPLFPFLLWTTNDNKSGSLFLKIDRKTIRVAAFEYKSAAVHPVLKAVSLAVKAAHVFNLEYHPHLRCVFNFLEHLMSLNTVTTATVSTFIAALRELQSA